MLRSPRSPRPLRRLQLPGPYSELHGAVRRKWLGTAAETFEDIEAQIHSGPRCRLRIAVSAIAVFAAFVVVSTAVSSVASLSRVDGVVFVAAAAANAANATCAPIVAFDRPLLLRTRAGDVHTIPPLPSEGSSAYEYAYQHALLMLPPPCVRAHRLVPNVAERPDQKTLWAGRLSELPAALGRAAPGAGVSTSALEALGPCGCGFVLFLHGSAGLTYDNWRYAAMMAAEGYVVLAPDSMAAPAELRLRHRAPVPDLASSLARNDSLYRWWCDDNVYADAGCASFTAGSAGGGWPLCYTSSAAEILAYPDAWRSYYARVFELRRREVYWALQRLESEAPTCFWGARRLILAGSSEGAMVAARLFHARLHARLSGLLLLQWSCESNYYVPCARDAAFCEGSCPASMPVLAVIAEQDPFFSATNADSIATKVARAQGYSLTGDCAAQFGRQRLERAVSIVIPQHGLAQHGLTEAVPNLMRALLGQFLSAPEQVASMEVVGPEAGLCAREEDDEEEEDEASPMRRRWSCEEIGNEPLQPLVSITPCSSWQGAQAHEEYYSGGPRVACAV